MTTTILDGETYTEALQRRYAEEAKTDERMNIIELAKEADIYVAHLNKPMTDKEVRLAFLERFATLVRAEALAEPVAVVDEIGKRLDGTNIFNAVGKVDVGQPLYAAPVSVEAAAIRARSEK